MLVCAPSNAAVDEIVARLVSIGVWNSSGELVKAKVSTAGSVVDA